MKDQMEHLPACMSEVVEQELQVTWYCGSLRDRTSQV